MGFCAPGAPPETSACCLFLRVFGGISFFTRRLTVCNVRSWADEEPVRDKWLCYCVDDLSRALSVREHVFVFARLGTRLAQPDPEDRTNQGWCPRQLPFLAGLI